MNIISKIKDRFSENSTLKNFFVYGIGQAINILSPLVITPYMIAVCGLSNFGVVSIGQALAFILIVVVDYSSNIVGVRDLSINRGNLEKTSQIFSLIYSARFFLTIITFVFLIILVFFVPFFKDEKTTFLLSFAIVLGQFLNPTWFFQGHENFKWISIINISSKILFLVLVFLFVKEKMDYIWVNLFFGLGLIFSNIVALVYISKKYNLSFELIYGESLFKYLKDDFSFCLSQLFLSFKNYLSVILVGYFLGDLVAGQYKVVEQIIYLIRTYLQMFFRFSYSYVCLAIDKGLERGFKLWQKFHAPNFILTVLLVVIIFFNSDDVLLFFKVNPELMVSTKIYLHFGLVIPLLLAVSYPLEQLLFSLERKNIYVRITIFATIVSLFFQVVALLFHNLKFVIISMTFVELGIIIIYYLRLRSDFKKISQ